MKKWLLALGLSLVVAMSVHAKEKIATVNTGLLFQKVASKNGISEILENEFKERTRQLRRMESDIQSKMRRLQLMEKGDIRTDLENSIIDERQTFSKRAQDFEQDRAIRFNEERNKLAAHIHAAVEFVASSQNIDLVIDTSTVAYNSTSVEDITSRVLKQVK